MLNKPNAKKLNAFDTRYGVQPYFILV